MRSENESCMSHVKSFFGKSYKMEARSNSSVIRIFKSSPLHYTSKFSLLLLTCIFIHKVDYN